MIFEENFGIMGTMKQLRFLALCLVFPLFSCQSSKQRVNLSQGARDTLIRQIRSGDPIDMENDPHKLKQLLMKSGMGAGYYYSYVLESQGDKNQAVQLLINEIEAHTAFSGRAALRFLNLTNNGAQHNFNLYNALIPIVRAHKDNPDYSLLLAIGYAAFNQKKYQEALDYLTAIDPAWLKIYPFSRSANMIISLSQTALELPDWQTDLGNFFLSQRGDKETEWALAWLRKELPSLSIPMYRIYEAVNLDSQNKYLPAYQIFKDFMRSNSAQMTKQPNLITQFANIAGRAKQRADAIQFLQPYLESLSGDALFQAQSALGALSFNQGQYQQAVRYLSPAIANGTRGKDLDRTIWYYMSAMYQSGHFEQLINEFSRLAYLWEDPYYFRRFLQTVLNDLVSRHYFHYIYQLYKKGLRELADPLTSVHYSWVLARATFHGLVITPDNIDKKNLYNSLLTDSLSIPWSYASIMAYAMLDEVPPFYKDRDIVPLDISGRVTNNTHIRADQDNELYLAFSERALGPSMVSDDIYALGFLYYGLENYPDIYPVISAKLKAMRQQLSTNALRLMGREFERRNFPADSISMMVITTQRDDFEPTKADYIAMYPRGHRVVLEEIAKTYDIPAHIMYGLVWNESLFQNHISSSVGAMGLGQLMPNTAKEMARRINMNEFDLSNPQQNLTLSAVYFDWLRQRFNQNLIHVLMSYNAGLGYVQKWINEWGMYPPEIFVEASPFGETRGYVRDITADSAIYGYLYFNIPPSQTVKTIFPNLKRILDDN